MNPFGWWNSLTAEDKARIIATLGALRTTLRTGLYFVLASAGASGVADDVSLGAWLSKHWIWFTLAFTAGLTDRVASKRNDPPPPELVAKLKNGSP